MDRISFSSDRYDAILVGARCAGAATAFLLARAGLNVLVVDRGQYGSDTLSTHALMRPAVSQLFRWGVLARIVDEGTPIASRTSFHYGDEVAAIDIKPRDGVEGLWAPRRNVLDRVLVDAAIAAGAEFRFGVQFDAVKTDWRGRVLGVHLRDQQGRSITLRAGVTIGADGVRSKLADQVTAPVYARSAHFSATLYGYFAGIENHGYRFYFQPGWSAGALPTNDNLHCVYASVRPEEYDVRFGADPLEGLARVVSETDPEIAEKLRSMGPRERLRRFGGIRGHLRQSHGAGWALVGDAGFFKDPITAHGLSDALLDAERLATAVLNGGEEAFEDYQETRDRFARPLLAVTDAVAALDWDLNRLKDLHVELIACMKAELAHANATFTTASMAA